KESIKNDQKRDIGNSHDNFAPSLPKSDMVEFENPNDQRLFTEELNYWGIKDDRLEEKKIE
ncbi:MAG: hypothetical protein ACK55Z_23910, partial [bacterium]